MEKQKSERFMLMYRPVHAKFEKFCKLRAYGRYEFQDLMQETITVAFPKFTDDANPSMLLSFLCGIAVKIMANHQRKKRTAEWNPSLDQFPAGREAEARDEKEVLYYALSQLPEDQKEAIILFEITGFSIREIAGIQTVSESAVKQRLVRGREKLLQVLETGEFAEPIEKNER